MFARDRDIQARYRGITGQRTFATLNKPDLFSLSYVINPLRLSACSDFSGSPVSLSRYSSELSASGRLPAAGGVRQRQQ